ncbi:MAG: hypothetical protein LBC53_09015 [Spirochaetaceae bacterium]|jgi:flagellar basal body-associated protein FliL|nr:hypothetical protein [Spirochaetaceae bacterium]
MKLSLNSVLTAVLAALALAIAVITAIVFISGGAARKTNPPDDSYLSAAGRNRLWTGLGRLRCPLKEESGKTPSILVIEAAFPYNREDPAFFNELAVNNSRFRAETVSFFASLKANDPILGDEEAVKKKLLERYNSFLRLGKIETLYFSDFLIID